MNYHQYHTDRKLKTFENKIWWKIIDLIYDNEERIRKTEFIKELLKEMEIASVKLL